MKNTTEKLREYGLHLSLDEEDLKIVSDFLFASKKKPASYTKKLAEYWDITVEEEMSFKEKFQFPEEYDALPHNIFETLLMECVQEGSIDFYQNESDFDIRPLLSEFIEEHLEDFQEDNKEFRLKQTFNPAEAVKWLTENLLTLANKLVADERTLPTRQRFYKELEAALKQDELIFMQSKQAII